MINKRLLEWSLLVVAIWVATFLRLHALGAESLWDGEIFTLLFAQYDWNMLLPGVSTFSAHPPLWFALTKLVIAGGWNETLLRMPAAFAGIAAVPALYALGKRLFDARAGLVGAVLLALSPMHVLFSQNARNYAFFVLLVIFLIYAAMRALAPAPDAAAAKRSQRWWILFVVSGLTGLYTHYLFVLPLGGTILAIVVRLVRDAVRTTGSWKNVRAWWGPALVAGRVFLLALVVIGAFYLPWTPTVGSAFLGRQLTREAGHEDDEAAALTLQTAPRLLKDFSGAATWGLVLISALALVGIVGAWQNGKRAALFWFGISIALPLGVMLLLAPRRLPAKYLIYVLPAFLLFVAYGITAIGELLGKRLFRANAPALAFDAGALLVLAFAAVPNMPYWNGTQTIFRGEGWAVVEEWKPWRAIAADVTRRAAPGDMILFPDEARALTARSVVPYFDDAFLGKVYSAPPQGHVWWVSEQEDVQTVRPTQPVAVDQFGSVVVQEWKPERAFRTVDLPNASFEEGFRDWTKSNELAQWSRDETIVVDGSAAARVTQLRADNGALRSTAFEVKPGKLYRVSAYVKNPTYGFYTVSPQLYITFYGQGGTPPRRTRLPTLAPSDKPGWMLMIADGIIPADAKTARVEFLFRDYAKTLNPTSWVDHVRVWLEE